MTDEPAHTAEDASETAVPLVEESAEELKKLGNECFATRKYDDALDYYKRALVIDPDNAILYSNRSACYAAQKLWQKAMEDAIMSISKDENFIKGYQRLATAQSELNLHDDAIATLRAALSKEPNNELLAKQLRIVQQKKSGLVAAQKPKKVMSENQRKEAMDLQEQTSVYVRDLKGVQSRLQSAERESRSTQMTTNHLATLDHSVNLYRSVGKAFFLTERESLERRLQSDQESLTKTQRDLQDRQLYLERRIQSNTTNLKDLMTEYAM